MNDNLLDLIYSFLHNRRQRVDQTIQLYKWKRLYFREGQIKDCLSISLC